MDILKYWGWGWNLGCHHITTLLVGISVFVVLLLQLWYTVTVFCSTFQKFLEREGGGCNDFLWSLGGVIVLWNFRIIHLIFKEKFNYKIELGHTKNIILVLEVKKKCIN